jgi:hypothetical protein
MGADPDPRAASGEERRRGFRNSAALIVFALALGAALLTFGLYRGRPQLYEPARGYLTEAALRLSETYSDEKTLARELVRVHHSLERTATLLEKAERVAPEKRRKIAALRIRLRALDDPEKLAAADPEALRRTYDEILVELKTLARELERSSS